MNRLDQLFDANYPSAITKLWLELPPEDFIRTLASEISQWLISIQDYAQLTSEDENVQDIEISGIALPDKAKTSVQDVMECIGIDAKMIQKLLDIAAEYPNDKLKL